MLGWTQVWILLTTHTNTHGIASSSFAMAGSEQCFGLSQSCWLPGNNILKTTNRSQEEVEETKKKLTWNEEL